MAGPLECQSLAAMQSLMDTNFFGLVRLVKEVLPDMKRRRGGHIVVISSIMGLQGIVFNDIYSASKFAVEGFCESLVVQALRFNVAISLVEPGPVMTEFETKLYEEAERADYSRTDPETAKIFTELYLRNSRDVFTSLGQTPEDIAEVTSGQGAPVGWGGLGWTISQLDLTRMPSQQWGSSHPDSSILMGLSMAGNGNRNRNGDGMRMWMGIRWEGTEDGDGREMEWE
uniref:Retinol dehydrogenase 8 n=1 Tax=Cyanistes caeruleus TaxID=156563 RepID=A0A8C0U7L5_CYACU